MTQDQIERLAREAGMEQDGAMWFTPSSDPLDTMDVSTEQLARFAALVEAAERERLAAWIELQRNDVAATGAEFAAAIRGAA